MHIPTKNQRVASWGGLGYGCMHVYQCMPKSNRSNQNNIGWKLSSKLYPYDTNSATQVNNFVTEMIKLPDNKYESVIVSILHPDITEQPYLML